MLGDRFPTVLHAPNDTASSPESSRDPAVFLPIVALYQKLSSSGYWKGKRVVFDAPKPADQSVKSAREKATKQADQKASHKPIDGEAKRAIEAS